MTIHKDLYERLSPANGKESLKLKDKTDIAKNCSGTDAATLELFLMHVEGKIHPPHKAACLIKVCQGAPLIYTNPLLNISGQVPT